MRLLGLVLIAACGVDYVPPVDDTVATGSDNGTVGVPLISGVWSVNASQEKYICVRQTITEDTYIKTILPIAPTGTHHFVLMIGDPDGPDGVTDCNSTLTKPAIFASGLGVQPLTMPDGIAVHLVPGQQLLLNVHLFNTGDSVLTGTSGIAMETSVPVDAAHSAGVALAGKMLGLTVDQGITTQEGLCTTPTAGTTMFAIAPHMHLLGTHLKATYGSNVLYDEDFAFDNQQFKTIAPVVTTAGGKIDVTCTYENHSGDTVHFGESTTEEMCFAITFAYPAPPSGTCSR